MHGSGKDVELLLPASVVVSVCLYIYVFVVGVFTVHSVSVLDDNASLDRLVSS